MSQVPCKQCLKLPLCRIRCDDLMNHVKKTSKMIFIIGLIWAGVVFALFTCFVITHKVAREEFKVLISVITTFFLIPTMITSFDSCEIAEYLARRYPE